MSRPWSPTKYFQAGRDAHIPDDTIELGIKLALRPQRKNLPAILSLTHLAKMSGTDPHLLDEIVKRNSNPYRIFSIRKRNGGKRVIYTPLGDLRVVQSWLHKHLLLSNSSSPYSYAYWPGKSTRDAAALHTRCTWLIKVDIEQFFESISEIQVYRSLRSMEFSALTSFQIARLCTRVLPVGNLDRRSRYGSYFYRQEHWKVKSGPFYDRYNHYQDPSDRIGALPQGAPTSPLLAELATEPLDEELAVVSGKHGLLYARYADDLSFSTTSKNFSRHIASTFIKEVYGALLNYGLRPNRTKTVVIPPGARKVVLGLLVDTDQPRLTNKFRDTVRQHLHFAQQFGPQAHSQAKKFDSVIGFKNHLYGLVSYAMSVEPEWAAERLTEFNNINWPL